MSFQVKIDERTIKEMKGIPDRYKKTFLATFGSKYQDKVRENARARSKGGRFWRKIAGGIKIERDDESVTIGTESAIAAHKEQGGIISAPGKGEGSKHSKYLTIPISEISKGKNTKDFNNLFMFKSKKGNLILAQTAKKKGSKKTRNRGTGLFETVLSWGKGELQPLFVLKKSVNQKPEPFFPDSSETRAVFEESMNRLAEKSI